MPENGCSTFDLIFCGNDMESDSVFAREGVKDGISENGTEALYLKAVYQVNISYIPGI